MVSQGPSLTAHILAKIWHTSDTMVHSADDWEQGDNVRFIDYLIHTMQRSLMPE
jgi:hypothetical protein